MTRRKKSILENLIEAIRPHKIRESGGRGGGNPYHKGPGPGGGQFASGASGPGSPVGGLAGEVNSLTMYHITTSVAAQKIAKHGFEYADKTNSVFGPGAYFSMSEKDIDHTIVGMGGKARTVVKVKVNVKNPFEIPEDRLDDWTSVAVKAAGGKVSRDGSMQFGKTKIPGGSDFDLELQRRQLAQVALKSAGYDAIVYRPEGYRRSYVMGGHQIVVWDKSKISVIGKPQAWK